jgi:hypothetical protein
MPSISHRMLFPFLQAVHVVQLQESVCVTARGLDPSGCCQKFGSPKKEISALVFIIVCALGTTAELL